MVEVQCEICGKAFKRFPSQIRSHIFCSRKCSRQFTSKRMRVYNRTENPMNTSVGWTDERRNNCRMREITNKPSSGKSYRKLFGRHEHRVVAEKVLGRMLRPGEVVHHIDGNKQNNAPDNLMVFKDQKEHIKHHLELGDGKIKGGDALC